MYKNPNYDQTYKIEKISADGTSKLSMNVMKDSLGNTIPPTGSHKVTLPKVSEVSKHVPQASKSSVQTKIPKEKEKGIMKIDSKGRKYLWNELKSGCCKYRVYRGQNPRKHCNAEIYKNGRCKYHHSKYRKANPFLFKD